MDLSESDLAPPTSFPDGEAKKAEWPIVCRAKPTLWWIVCMGTLVAAFTFTAPFFMFADAQNSQHSYQNLNRNPYQILWASLLVCWPFALFMGTAALWQAVELKRGEIRADATGLTWRGVFGGWKSARWNEITDLYQRQRGSEVSRVVETPAGKLTLSSSYEGIDRIAEKIVEKASHLNNYGWEEEEMRSREEWSRTFSMWSNDQKWTAPSMTLIIFGPLLLAALTLMPPAQQPRSSLGFWLDTFPLIILFALFAPMIALAVWSVIIMWRDRKFAWNHRDESMVVSAQGLVFSNRDHSISARWEEVKRVVILPPKQGQKRVRIETSQGDFSVWSGQNTGLWPRIRPIMKQYAPRVLEPHEETARERVKQEEDLEGERGAWSGGQVGSGARRWGFRSRGTRFAFQCASFVIALVPFLYLIFTYSLAPPDGAPNISWPLFSGLCLLSGLMVAAGWLWWGRAEILASEDGLEVRSPFTPPRRATWRSIDGQGKDAWGEFVSAQGRNIYFMRLLPPVRVEELRAHIEARIAR